MTAIHKAQAKSTTTKGETGLLWEADCPGVASGWYMCGAVICTDLDLDLVPRPEPVASDGHRWLGASLDLTTPEAPRGVRRDLAPVQ